MNKFKKLLFCFIAILITLFICFLLLEVILRIFTEASVTPGYERTHPERRYEFKPNFRGKTCGAELKINLYGLRDYERPISKAEGVYRICIFGDSITFGYGVNIEDTFSKVLERKLNKVYKKPVQVFNFGIPSYNTVFKP